MLPDKSEKHKEKKRGKKEGQFKWKKKRREKRKEKSAEEEMTIVVEAVIEIVETETVIEETEIVETEIVNAETETGKGIEDQEVNVDLEVATEVSGPLYLKGEVPLVVIEMWEEIRNEVTEVKGNVALKTENIETEKENTEAQVAEMNIEDKEKKMEKFILVIIDVMGHYGRSQVQNVLKRLTGLRWHEGLSSE